MSTTFSRRNFLRLSALGNIAYELDHPLERNPIVQKFMNDVEANSKLHYEYRKPYTLD